jgi:hypothetical protein
MSFFGYTTSIDEWVSGIDAGPLFQSLTETISGTSVGQETASHRTLSLLLAVSAASGTSPSLTLTVQTSNDDGNTDPWRNVGSFPAQTAAGSVRQSFAGLDRWVRLSWAITGTSPSFTFTTSGELV